jgi:hypothetical protein
MLTAGLKQDICVDFIWDYGDDKAPWGSHFNVSAHSNMIQKQLEKWANSNAIMKITHRTETTEKD